MEIEIKTQPFKHLQKGYTLIEVMIALVIVVIVMLFGFGYFVYGNRVKVNVNETIFALDIARNNIENIKEMSWTNLIASYGDNGEVALGTEHYPGNNDIDYNPVIIGETYPAGTGSSASYITVSVIVRWQSAETNILRHVRLTTIIAAPPPS